MKKETPAISVVMPVYNEEKYIKEAIDSILNQTYTDFEFIILNDGSADKTEEIILSYNDPRIVYVKNDENLQIAKTLNKGIAMAKGKYIARMDADDISLPRRFEKQIKFMEENPDIGVCGTWLKTFGSKKELWKMPTNHNVILMEMIFNSCLMHPTVILRKNVFNFGNKVFYKQNFNGAEDYELWVTLSSQAKFSNIPEALLRYRLNNSSNEKQVYKEKQKALANKIREQFLKMHNLHFSEDELEFHNKIANNEYEDNCEFLEKTKKWFFKIVQNNKKEKFVPNDICEDFLVRKFYRICSLVKSCDNSYDVLYYFLDGLEKKYLQLRIKTLIKRALGKV